MTKAILTDKGLVIEGPDAFKAYQDIIAAVDNNAIVMYISRDRFYIREDLPTDDEVKTILRILKNHNIPIN